MFTKIELQIVIQGLELRIAQLKRRIKLETTEQVRGFFADELKLVERTLHTAKSAFDNQSELPL